VTDIVAKRFWASEGATLIQTQIGLIWLILNAESTVPGHRGKISFYAADTDFEVDLHYAYSWGRHHHEDRYHSARWRKRAQ
jgi:hypothetical protein